MRRRSFVVTAGLTTVVLVVGLAAARHDPAAKVVGVYPTALVVPSNLLRFYIEFSRSMQAGDAYQHIHLLDAKGRPIDRALLALDDELWDPEQRRLTVLFDPGRIKRGLRSNLEMGAPLHESEIYRIVIDSSWRDGNDRPLGARFAREFRIGAFDDHAPDPARWRISPPGVGTRAWLEVAFDEPLDHALASRMLRVEDANGEPVPGSATLLPGDRDWRFVPATPWREGTITLRIGTALEDLAGNSIARNFDTDLASGSRSSESRDGAPASVTRAIVIAR